MGGECGCSGRQACKAHTKNNERGALFAMGRGDEVCGSLGQLVIVDSAVVVCHCMHGYIVCIGGNDYVQVTQC